MSEAPTKKKCRNTRFRRSCAVWTCRSDAGGFVGAGPPTSPGNGEVPPMREVAWGWTLSARASYSLQLLDLGDLEHRLGFGRRVVSSRSKARVRRLSRRRVHPDAHVCLACEIASPRELQRPHPAARRDGCWQAGLAVPTPPPERQHLRMARRRLRVLLADHPHKPGNRVDLACRGPRSSVEGSSRR